MPHKVLSLQFPAAGVVRRLGYRDSADARAPYPTPWALNVRLQDALTGRLRGGSWAGIAADAVPSATSLYLVTEDGDNIVTEDGELILLDDIVSVGGGSGRQWVAPGSDAPESSHPAECLYRDRLLRPEGNVIFASRQGNYTDWNYGADVSDLTRPVAFQLSEGGEVGLDVVALVPHKDQYLAASTATSLWVVQGDPADGSMQNISREVGMIGGRAWCKAHDTVYFLSSLGLYSVNASGDSRQAISEDKIPAELIGIVDPNAVLVYNHADRGVYIHLSDAISWFYDTERQQFWPFDTDSSNSHVLVGPVRLWSSDEFGRLAALHGTLASGSDYVTWRLIRGDTAEEAAENGKTAIGLYEADDGSWADYVFSSGTWSGDRARVVYPRCRAMWVVVWLQSQGEWAFENVTLEVERSGRWR